MTSDARLTAFWIAVMLTAGIALNAFAIIPKAKSQEVGDQYDRGFRHYIPLEGEHYARARGGVVVGSRPAGCPRRFCACALSIRKFGRIIPHLNLAANWRSFPRAAPASGMIAARRGHVFDLVSHISGSVWMVWDANSGRGRIRLHPRSIAGYSIHNPHGGRIREARAG